MLDISIENIILECFILGCTTAIAYSFLSYFGSLALDFLNKIV